MDSIKGATNVLISAPINVLSIAFAPDSPKSTSTVTISSSSSSSAISAFNPSEFSNVIFTFSDFISLVFIQVRE